MNEGTPVTLDEQKGGFVTPWDGWWFPVWGQNSVSRFLCVFLIQVPTIGHYLIDMEKYFSDAYDALFLKKQRCDIAMATPFPNEELCGHKICQYYAS